jgi:hypothetical protein
MPQKLSNGARPQEFGLKLWHTWTFAIGYFTGESQTVYDITIYTDAVEN